MSALPEPANAAGTPRRHPPNFPAGREGRAPANKGLKLPAEILSQAEIAALLDSFSPSTLAGKRNRAMVALMYQAEVKVGQIVALAVRHYDEQQGTLAVPGIGGARERTVRLDVETRALLGEWIGTPSASPHGHGTALLHGAAAARAAPAHELDPQRSSATGRPSESRGGFDRKDSASHGERIERARRVGSNPTLAEYIGGDDLRARHPTAFQKWTDAHELLELAPDRHATTIGHLCREAINEFSDDLAREFSVGPFDANKTK